MRRLEKVAIIVLNYNGLTSLGPHALYNCLKSILKTDYPDYIVIFVDNGSRDRSVSFVYRYFKEYIEQGKLEIIKLNKNYGWSGGNNRGAWYAIKKYRPKYLVFLNNDIYIKDPLWLSKLIKTMEKYSLDLVSPLIYEEELKALVAGDIISKNCTPKPFIVDEVTLNKLKHKNINFIRLRYLHGAALMIRSRVFKVLKGFDESIFAYFDETDFCERAYKHGFNTATAIDVVINHYGGATFKALPCRLFNVRIEKMVESLLKFVKKHYGTYKLFYVLLNIIAWLFIETGKANFKKALAILRGLIIGLRVCLMLPKYTSKA